MLPRAYRANLGNSGWMGILGGASHSISTLADTCCYRKGRDPGHFHSKIRGFLHHCVPFDFCFGDSSIIQSTN